MIDGAISGVTVNNGSFNKSLVVVALTLTISACGLGKDHETDPQYRVVQGVNFVGLSVSDMARSNDLYNGSTTLQLIKEALLSDHPSIKSLADRSNLNEAAN